jgi:hypothetical protein
VWINWYSAPASKLNALEALVRIGQHMVEDTDGEIHKALVGCCGSISALAMAITSVVELMSVPEKRGALERLEGMGALLREYGNVELEEYVREAQRHLEDGSEEEEEEDEDEDEDVNY